MQRERCDNVIGWGNHQGLFQKRMNPYHLRVCASAFSPHSNVISLILLSVQTVVLAFLAPGCQKAALNKDFAGLVDIGGGRKIYMECRGSGSPTVVLISGKGNRADIWNVPNPEKPGPTVFPEVARFTRVCAYDRPGTTGALASEPSRSDPVPEPVTAAEGVSDLRALLTASKEVGPFVLAGHSIGGLISRLYASTYPQTYPASSSSTHSRRIFTTG